MNPWEKVCPVESGNDYCQECHGTGYVPMSTDEMLEALGDLCEYDLSCSICKFAVWIAPSPAYERDEIQTAWLDSPADALRAALEAVSG